MFKYVKIFANNKIAESPYKFAISGFMSVVLFKKE